MRRGRRLAIGVVLAACATLSVTALAVASTPNPRTVTITDPKDAPAPLSGPANPDVQSVTVSYDTAGTITVSLTFWAPVEVRPPGDDTLGLNVAVSQVVDPIIGCTDNSPEQNVDEADISLFITDPTTSTLGNYAELVLGNEPGDLQVPVAHTAGSATYSATFTNTALANRDWRCASAEDLIGIPACPLYPDCDPASTEDVVGKSAWFDGFAPGAALAASWKVSARRTGKTLDVIVRNSKATGHVSYKLCLALRTGRPRCKNSILVGVDDLTFPLDTRVVRPLQVTIYVAGVLQATKRVPIR